MRNIAALTSLFTVVGAAAPAGAAEPETALSHLEDFWVEVFGPGQVEPFLTLDRDLLMKAQPDECFNGIGAPHVPDPSCLEGVPKVNEGYVFGLTKAGDDLWTGTVTNMPCLVLAQMSAGLGVALPPHVTSSYACEFGASAYAPPGVDPLVWASLLPYLGDWRPPHIYRYDQSSETRTDMTPADARIFNTLGIRAAGTHDGIVLLAGPTLEAGIGSIAGGTGAGINVFAFKEDGTYLGSTELTEYSDIRKFVVVDGVLYTTVKNSFDSQGSVLRWYGDETDPFDFRVVGEIADEGANIAVHDGRLFVTTWPDVFPPDLAGGGAGLWMSPLIPLEGLTEAHAALWQRVWSASDYDLDPATAATYLGGDLVSFDGYLYWTTMHAPMLPAAAHILAYGLPTDPVDVLTTILGTHRPMHVFRGKHFGTSEEVQEVVYGLPFMPTYDPVAEEWAIVPNGMGMPLWGLAGFGNFFNMYGWTAETYYDQLFIGTLDLGYMFSLFPEILLAILGLPVPDHGLVLPTPVLGADLWRFADADVFAVPESLSGVGNYANYGIRTMVADDALYLGTANPMNLLTDPTDLRPEGGWELLRLSGVPPPTPIASKNEKLEIERRVWVPCADGGNGEWVAAEGRLHVVVEAHVDPVTHHHTLHLHSNFQKFKGVGETTGDHYNVNGASDLTFEMGPPPFGMSFSKSFGVIGKGHASKLRMHAGMFLRVSPGWRVEVGLDDLRVDCK